MNFQLIVTALLVLKSISRPQPPGPSPTAADPHLTTLDANPPIDVRRDGTGLVAISERGFNALHSSATLFKIFKALHSSATLFRIVRHFPPVQHYLKFLRHLHYWVKDSVL